ncbi:3'-5' exonuclease [Parasalinivibrio latis]|uniref:3'-5' exonuclease n=1 Tax=Parasalinivibrio latis TaxID=2952610 RepID=UPI0030DE47CD
MIGRLRTALASRHPLAKLEKQRQQLLEKGQVPAPLLPLYQVPVPQADARWETLSFLVLDFETSGLDPSKDRILSIGYVSVENSVLKLSSAKHIYVDGGVEVCPEAAVINHITPQNLAGGCSDQEGISHLVRQMAGKVVIAHGSAIERGFLHQALGINIDFPLPVVWLDTLMLERSLAVNRGCSKKDFRLCTLREQKGLPAYHAHNALVDAVATGELFLVLVREILGREKPILGPLFIRSCYGRP